ncbi:MAG: tRNA 2-selenouridine(34) synthase MnmH [Planctomycetes bacterium]|jgi:tRNA 2-selenouridine synthase|nr:tRNA 2-selenouridine(34) synthase MnmH [Planctomycetota bacterium]MDP6408128.1 tRNA 2-selenouridine(34) synthase MnmH [Planctomycetota bacterium]
MDAARESPSGAWIVPTVSARSVLASAPGGLIDLRSPGEFAADHLPGAFNAPLFDDVERALIGTLYRRESPQRAFEEGRRATEDRIADLAEELSCALGRPLGAEDPVAWVRTLSAGGLEGMTRAIAPRPVPPGENPAGVLYCWRGGLRSLSVVAFCREALGWRDVCALEGGYKAYRARVLEELETWSAPRTVVLRGWTGVGKTLVLRELERLRPGATLDLEACAGHRSSVLGMVGLEPCSQRSFDSRVAGRLREGPPPVLVVEGESRKVGDVIIPGRVWAAMQGGENVLLTADLERRKDVLVEEYLASPTSRGELRERLGFIEGRLGAKKWDGALVALLDSGRERELVEVLLERYYDPLYRHSETGRAVTFELDATDPARAAAELADWTDGRG